jgi:imidazolonepropionase-like amidohydrolase
MKTIIQGGSLFDAVDGRVRKNGAVVVRNKRIEAVLPPGKPVRAEPDDIVFDLDDGQDACLLPGLIDTHLHLAHGGFDKREKSGREALLVTRFVHNGIKNLMNGITTVRDCGAANHMDVAYRKALSLNLVAGPRTYISGQPLIATGGHCTYMGRQVDGPYDAMRGTREQIEKMVDFIKIMVTGGLVSPTGTPTSAQLTMQEISAIVEVAHMNGKRVSVHLQGGPSLIPCVEAGIDILDHGIYLTDADVECLAKHGIPYIPTLAAIYLIAHEGEREVVPVDAMTVEKAKHAVEAHMRSFEKAVKAGLLIGAGTDYKHGILGVELELMTRGGFSTVQALNAATRDAARILGIDDRLGTIETGKIADFLVVKGDPVRDIRDVRNVRMVFQNGDLVVRDDMLRYPGSYISEPVQPVANDGK